MRLVNRDEFGLSGRFACVVLLSVLLVATAPVLAGATNNPCDEPGESPDVIVGSLHAKQKYGTVGTITAFSIGTTSCNIGTCWLEWFDNPSNLHPVIGQNMYRLKDGRFEQIGQSWLKHGFFALSQTLCFPDCIPTGGEHLGVHCSDPYSSSLNGQQNNLGPKFEVNAGTGSHPHPVTNIGLTGNAIFKRMQVENADLDPGQNAGALYFIEGHYVTADDAAAGNDNNNASYRKVLVTGVAGSGNYDFNFDGSTLQQQAGIRAWADFDTGVHEVDVQVPGDGLFILASKVTDNGDGTWHYEYAVHNLNSHRSADGFSVPIPANATINHIDFHDSFYHSGAPEQGTNWTDNGGAGTSLTWSAVPAGDTTTNALRWGTLYNFRFDADVPPDMNLVTIDLFRAGDPSSVSVVTMTPTLCNENSICDPGETGCNCLADCGAPPSSEGVCGDGADNDCDNMVDCADVDCCGDGSCPQVDGDGDTVLACADCDDSDNSMWLPPSEALNLIMASGPSGTVLTWDPPVSPGASTLTGYEVLRARNPSDFVNFTQCVTDSNPTDTTVVDPVNPAIGMFSFLVRAENACPGGSGTLGSDSQGDEREGRTCP